MEIVKPAFETNNVAVCFSANDNYAPLLATTIASIVEFSSSQKNYDLVVLFTNLSDENQTKLLSVTKNRKNFSLRFVDVTSLVIDRVFYTESDLANTKYTPEIYFRLLAPAVFSGYSKLVFLDADLVVKADIAELFDTPLSNAYLAAVRDYEGIAACYNNNYERTKYRIGTLKIKNFNDYFISGVLVLNLKKFNSTYSVKTLLDLATSKNWRQYDQDLLNFLCQGDVKILSADWDFVEDIYHTYTSLPDELFDEYQKSEANPKIIHYAGNRKPWKNVDSRYSADFWKFAAKTPYENYLKKLLKEQTFSK